MAKRKNLVDRVKARVGAGPLVGFNLANRNAWVAEVARQQPHGTRILDMGAGTCPYRQLFAHCEYRTQDFGSYEGTSAGPMQDDWQYGEIDYVSDIVAVPAPDGSFDAILCTEVIEHVPDPPAVIREAARLLRPGGHLYMSAPLGSGLHQEPFHFYGGFTPHFYERFMGEAGLEIDSIAPNGGFFRHLVQEMERAAVIVEQRRPYPRWHPLHWVLLIGFRVLAPRWLTRLDDEIPVAELTVGYHVEAHRPAAP